MLITSKDNSKIKEARKLLDKKYSNNKKLFLIEGENLVLEAFKNNLLIELFVLDGYECSIDFPYVNCTLEVMKTLSDLKSTPRLIGVSRYNLKDDLGSKIVILDDIQDPGNAGTIIRSSVAFGIDTIVLSKNSVSPYNPKVLRSTGGMIYNINIVIDDLENVINNLKKNNIKIIGSSLKESNNLESVNIKDKYAIVVGNEGNGVSDKVLSLCDEIVRIDMEESCESLNVGVATSIILYHMYKR
jgi:TrmH family RNA methyltransferase